MIGFEHYSFKVHALERIRVTDGLFKLEVLDSVG